MSFSSFKSTSKRGNSATTSTPNVTSSSSKGSNSDKTSNKNVPHRRSRSVSAVSRSSSTVNDFLNKRDNPLFNISSSPPQDLLESENLVKLSKFNEDVSKAKDLVKKPVGMGAAVEVSDGRRGRPAWRNAETGNVSVGGRKEIGRSVSRVDLGRQRSVSRRPVSRGHYDNSESEKEQRSRVSPSSNVLNNRNRIENMKKVTSDSDLSSHGRNLQNWSSQNQISQPSDVFSSCVQDISWEDGISTSSFSEAEEKTIKAVFEQIENNHPAGDAGAGEIYEAVRSEVRLAISEIRNDLKMAIQRKDPTAADNVGDIPPELVNPDAVELVSDIRRDYAKKLEQSEERAKKLRADLAVEEHRGQELGRILKEILPEPKASETRQSRFRRKNSNERRKISRCLTEEAMNYFDECVSISTFDSSDFSSTEDPSVGFVAATPLVDKNVCFPSSSASSNHGIPGHLAYKKELDSAVQSKLRYSDLTRGSSSKNANEVQDNVTDLMTERSMSHQFSSAHDPVEAGRIHYDIGNYIKKFEKKTQTDTKDFKSVKLSCYDSDDYELRVPDEKFLLHRLILNHRIESGGLHLCGGGVAIL